MRLDIILKLAIVILLTGLSGFMLYMFLVTPYSPGESTTRMIMEYPYSNAGILSAYAVSCFSAIVGAILVIFGTDWHPIRHHRESRSWENL